MYPPRHPKTWTFSVLQMSVVLNCIPRTLFLGEKPRLLPHLELLTSGSPPPLAGQPVPLFCLHLPENVYTPSQLNYLLKGLATVTKVAPIGDVVQGLPAGQGPTRSPRVFSRPREPQEPREPREARGGPWPAVPSGTCTLKA